MNLIDAIADGRDRRRLGSTVDWVREWHTKAVWYDIADITAGDWEVREAAVTITASQFWEAAREWRGGVPGLPYTNFNGRKYVPIEHVPDLNELARRLGLED